MPVRRWPVRAGWVSSSPRDGWPKRRGLRLHERPWMNSAATLARKYDLPVVPVHIGARNSALFYLFDAIHPSLRDITLFHETFNKATQPFAVTIGAPLMPRDLPCDPGEATAVLRAATLGLGETTDAPGQPLLAQSGGAAGALFSHPEPNLKSSTVRPGPRRCRVKSLARIRRSSAPHGQRPSHTTPAPAACP